MRFRVTFIARRVGALGIRYENSLIIDAPNVEMAKRAVYDVGWEHVTFVKVEEVKTRATGGAV